MVHELQAKWLGYAHTFIKVLISSDMVGSSG
jgi:hypothetical protein